MSSASDRLREARKNAGFESAAAAAKALGMNYQTYVSHENGHRDYSHQAGTYARRFGVTTDWLLTARKGANASTQYGELKPIQNYNGMVIPVTGAVQAGSWLDRNDEMAHELDSVYPASPKYPPRCQRAFRVIGESLNKVAKPDAILIAVDLIEAGIEVADGDLVIVERSQYNGQKVEVTAKRIRKTLAGYELWPESDDPRYQEPIALNGAEDHEEIRVAAKVLWIINEP